MWKKNVAKSKWGCNCMSFYCLKGHLKWTTLLVYKYSTRSFEIILLYNKYKWIYKEYYVSSTYSLFLIPTVIHHTEMSKKPQNGVQLLSNVWRTPLSDIFTLFLWKPQSGFFQEACLKNKFVWYLVNIPCHQNSSWRGLLFFWGVRWVLRS